LYNNINVCQSFLDNNNLLSHWKTNDVIYMY
jgi:hypothetical protein